MGGIDRVIGWLLVAFLIWCAWLAVASACRIDPLLREHASSANQKREMVDNRKEILMGFYRR